MIQIGIGSNNVGYDGRHGGFRYRDRNADGFRILAFADGLNLIICNTLFMKQESQLVSYAAGRVILLCDRMTKRKGMQWSVNLRGIKLLEHAMKVVERMFEHGTRQQIDADDIRFGFMKGKGTTDAIFIVREMQEKFRVKEKKLYFGFVDLENTFNRVPREVIRSAMHKLGV